MKTARAVRSHEYSEVRYAQFNRSASLRIAMKTVGILCWPFVMPLALVSKISDDIFHTCSQLVALVPFLLGDIVRYEFYRFALAACGTNVMIGFGTVFQHRDISIGSNVLIGMFCTVQYCDMGSYVLIADGCRFLSGAHHHFFGRTDLPMALQGGELTRISLGDDVWIGANAIVMSDVHSGSIVGAGAVVTHPVAAYRIAAGNPAREIGRRPPRS